MKNNEIFVLEEIKKAQRHYPILPADGTEPLTARIEEILVPGIGKGSYQRVYASNDKELLLPEFDVPYKVSEADALTMDVLSEYSPHLDLGRTMPTLGSVQYELIDDKFGYLCKILLREKDEHTEVQIGNWRKSYTWKNADEESRKAFGFDEEWGYYSGIVIKYCNCLQQNAEKTQSTTTGGALQGTPAAGKPGRPSYSEDVWAHDQIFIHSCPKKEVYKEWIKKIKENPKRVNLDDPGRQFKRIVKPEWGNKSGQNI